MGKLPKFVETPTYPIDPGSVPRSSSWRSPAWSASGSDKSKTWWLRGLKEVLLIICKRTQTRQIWFPCSRFHSTFLAFLGSGQSDISPLSISNMQPIFVVRSTFIKWVFFILQRFGLSSFSLHSWFSLVRWSPIKYITTPLVGEWWLRKNKQHYITNIESTTFGKIYYNTINLREREREVNTIQDLTQIDNEWLLIKDLIW